MELYMVKDKAGKVYGEGFPSRHLAKERRNELQALESKGIPAFDFRDKVGSWDYTVTKERHHLN